MTQKQNGVLVGMRSLATEMPAVFRSFALYSIRGKAAGSSQEAHLVHGEGVAQACELPSGLPFGNDAFNMILDTLCPNDKVSDE